MKKFYVFVIAVLGLSSCAQEVERKTFVNVGNPLVRDNYTADPAPMVASDGRLYVFCGHDECFEDRPGYEGNYGFNITEWLCYSTEDMHTWTDHGVAMKPTDFSWSIGEAWASQVIEADGKYWFYVSTQCGEPNCKAIGEEPKTPGRRSNNKRCLLCSQTLHTLPVGASEQLRRAYP